MFFTYLRRELRRRRKAAFVVASGLALGIALVIVVTSVSAGMNAAQDKVLQSLYGLGTDMTVTKAQTPPGENGQPNRPRFQFDAKGDGDANADAEQSHDIVMPQGFQTLDAATVGKVSGQNGVAQAVGGLSLQVMKVNGQFKRGELRRSQGGGNGGGGRGG
ncbi:ABC transporter permease, partial [Streptomyces sp. M-16]